MAGNKLKNILSGINKTGEQLINSVLNNNNSSINSAPIDVIYSSSDEKIERSVSISSNNSVTSNTEISSAEGFLCPQCFHAFPNAQILTEHFSSEHSTFDNKNLFTNCSHCKMRFSNENELIQHVEKYHISDGKKSTTEENRNKNIITELDQSATKQLRDTFSQVLQSAFNKTSNKNIDVEKVISAEELDLLERQQKALEETKDLLLNELSLLRKELSKKDMNIEKMEKSFQNEKQLLIIQLNEAFKQEKKRVKDLNNLKNEIITKETELSQIKSENENLKFANKHFEEQIEILKNEKNTDAKLVQQLKEECNANQKVILELTNKTSDSMNLIHLITKEKSTLNDKISELQLEINSLKKSNEQFEMQIKCWQMKNSNSGDYDEQIKKMESTQRKELEDHPQTIKQLQSFYLNKMNQIRNKLHLECSTLNTLRSKVKQNNKIMDDSKQQIEQIIQDIINKNDLAYKTKKQMINVIEDKNQLDNENNILKNKIDELELNLKQNKNDFQKRIEELLTTNDKYEKELSECGELIKTLNESKELLQNTIIVLTEKINDIDIVHKQEINKSQKQLNKVTDDLRSLKQIILSQSLQIKSTIDCLKTLPSDLTQFFYKTKLETNFLIKNISENVNKIQINFTNKVNELINSNNKLEAKNKELMEVTLPEKEEALKKLIKSEALIKSYMESLKATLKEMKSKEEENKKAFIQAQNEKQILIAEIEKEKARFVNVQQYHDQVLGEKLKLEIELSTFLEEKRILLERCVASEEQFETAERELKALQKKLEEMSKVVHELGLQNQTLQIRIDEANQKLRRSWTDDRSVDKCMNEECRKQFTTVIRKHHCRSCGNIFCNECSSKQTQMTGHPKPVRVCDGCYNELNQP